MDSGATSMPLTSLSLPGFLLGLSTPENGSRHLSRCFYSAIWSAICFPVPFALWSFAICFVT